MISKEQQRRLIREGAWSIAGWVLLTMLVAAGLVGAIVLLVCPLCGIS